MPQPIKEGAPGQLSIAEQIADADSLAVTKADRLYELYPHGLDVQQAGPVAEVVFTLGQPGLKPREHLAALKALNAVYDRILNPQTQPRR